VVVFVVGDAGLGVGAGRWAAVDLVSGRLGREKIRVSLTDDKSERGRR
jgi:hypothetical protein